MSTSCSCPRRAAVLAERGYDGLRVDDVLQRAGLSTRAFYRHFSGKAGLYLALFEEESVRADEHLRSHLAGASTPAAKVREWVTSVLALAYDARLEGRSKLFAGERGARQDGSPKKSTASCAANSHRSKTRLRTARRRVRSREPIR